MNIAIANDHGGVVLKEILVKHLSALGHRVENLGSDGEEIVRYPLYVAKAMRVLVSGGAERVILVCSTGIGVSVVANKFRGVRAALCGDPYMAKMTRRHNDSNVLCLGGKTTGEDLAKAVCETWLDTEYEGGRHDISLGIIADMEGELLTGALWEARKQYP